MDYDLFVIGGGSGGVRAARIAAEAGARVALAEEYRMGGTCVIRGCVPKKLMVYASNAPHHIDEARGYGWDVTLGEFDWGAFRRRLDGELDRLEGAYRGNLHKAGVQVYDTRARLEDPHEVRLETGERLQARHILIATGGHPSLPHQAENWELGITSNDVFKLDRQPKTLLIVGGGYIACEFAGIFNGLGTKVTQLYRGAQILRGFDDEARHIVAEGMRRRGIALQVETDVTRLERAEGGIRAHATDGTDKVYDQVLFATGRQPNTHDLGLERAGVALGEKGEVMVDAWSQTGVPSIFAIGDVTDRMNLTPVAIREGHAFADTIFGGRKHTADHDLVPSAVFTQPELGTVGLTEEAAREAHAIEVYCTAFRPMQTAFLGHQERVLFKLVVDAESRRVLGCHIVAPNAGELIQMVAVAVKMGATKEDFDRTVAVHPTISEEIVTMRHPVRHA